jgi:hypothetical protein
MTQVFVVAVFCIIRAIDVRSLNLPEHRKSAAGVVHRTQGYLVDILSAVGDNIALKG